MNVDFDFLKYATSAEFLEHSKAKECEHNERAGILEYEGGLSSQDDELQAVEEIDNRFSDEIPF